MTDFASHKQQQQKKKILEPTLESSRSCVVANLRKLHHVMIFTGVISVTAK
jgi:hypothetical protein